LSPANCKHDAVEKVLNGVVADSGGLLHMENVGRSLEGRSINLIRCGTGETKVLLWSQMHGDEPTATLALVDVFSYLTSGTGEEWIRSMLKEITIHAIPMLNPDGAERAQRRTASNIDVNRDARALMTPEACILKETRDRLQPAFGFNLHDQELSSVGQSTNVAAIALLAPAPDHERTIPAVRMKAIQVAALIARELKLFAEGHLAKYDDTHEPRAFGDSMQGWGTSTVLIESGHWPGDPGKRFIRKLNFVSLLRGFASIAQKEYIGVDRHHYNSLEQNGKRMYELIIRDILIEHTTGWTARVDVAVSRNAGSGENGLVTVRDLGDLSTFGALGTMSAKGKRVSHQLLAPEVSIPLAHLIDAHPS
ncbi:MAG: M14 family zinc carboxypeptidase, partial [Ignavibacteria bacterium]|nr:M14 family zinc carboxypeptidase [Ignavibacteria bacterium]